MIYPDSFEKKVGFDRVRELLAEKCLGPLGKERCEKISFSTKPEEIRMWIDQADEFKQLIETGEPFPLDNYFDLRPTLKRMRISGSHPELGQLFNLKRSLETIKSVNHYLSNIEPERFPRLKELGKYLKVFPTVHDRINRIMRDWGFSFQSGEGEKISGDVSGDVHKKLKYLTHIQ